MKHSETSANSSPSARWDVIIIGGGPAGSTAATVLAKAGRRVLLLEKAKFPRFHVGESLLPYNMAILDELGVRPEIEEAGFMVKRGAQFWTGSGSHRLRLDFSKGSFTEQPRAFQVERSKFDHLLLKHAERSGAEVREECVVTGHRVEEDGVTVTCRGADGGEREETAAFLIDASGLSNFTAVRESRREYYPGHKKVAVFGHFSGLTMPEGEEHGDIVIVRRENSWFWLIPLENDKTSAGLVMDRADFQAAGKRPEEIHHDAVRSTPAVAEVFQNARSLTPLHTVTDFSYRNDRLVSPRLVRAGDASGFIDPIFSSGVLLAMTGGRDAALAVCEALTLGKALTPGMKRYERNNRRRIAQYWRFIENFYRPHFAQIFFQPFNRARMVCAINAVLAGRTRLSFAVRWRLGLFFLLARINRRLPVVPRVTVR